MNIMKESHKNPINLVIALVLGFLFMTPGFSGSLIAQSASLELVPYRLGDRWGYSDRKGQILIGAEYDAAERFSENRAVVAKNGKYGFIDPSGRVVIPIEYDSAQEFSNGMALVSKNEAFGYVNNIGRLIVPLGKAGKKRNRSWILHGAHLRFF